jgi:hypothetical protein
MNKVTTAVPTLKLVSAQDWPTRPVDTGGRNSATNFEAVRPQCRFRASMTDAMVR